MSKEVKIQKVELKHPNGYKFCVFLSEYEINRAENDAQFLKELLDKYNTSRKKGLITAEKINLPQDVENLADSDHTDETSAKPLDDLSDANGGAVGYNPGNQNEQSEIWNEEETRLLINLYGEHVDDFKHARKKKNVWIKISEKMSSKGIYKTAERCQRKWINLTRVYRSIKDNTSPRKTRRGRVCYKYFNALDKIIGHRPSNSVKTYIFDAEASTSSVKGNGKNYMQEYFKKKLENEEREREIKRLRHEEKMDIERQRINLEEQQIQLLKQVLSKLNNGT